MPDYDVNNNWPSSTFSHLNNIFADTVACVKIEHPPLTYGARVKALRKLARLSQEELAERSGISQGQISNIERDVATPEGTRHHTIESLARQLKTTVEYLRDGAQRGGMVVNDEQETRLVALFRQLPSDAAREHLLAQAFSLITVAAPAKRSQREKASA